MSKFYLNKWLLAIIVSIVLLFAALIVLVANVESSQALRVIIIYSVSSIFIIGLMLFLFVTKFKLSFNHFLNQLSEISEGNINAFENSNINTNTIFSSVNVFLEQMSFRNKEQSELIQNIIEDNPKAVYTPHGENDLLGNKLVELSNNLKGEKEELEKSKDEEQKRNWVANGLAKFSEILRLDNRNLEDLGHMFTSNLVDYIGFNQGAIYILSEEEGEDDNYKLVSAVAYNRRKLLDCKIKIGEGLVGRCAHEKATIYMTDIPDNYMNITSGLGESSPRNLLLVPCKLDKKVFAIIELASFNLIEKFQIEFIEKLGESLASTIANAQINEKTTRLLTESKTQSEELAAQEEELRQNLEEMEATQEDLKRQMETNNLMRKELSYEKFLFDTLLEQIPSRIFFKDRQGCFVKASKSIVEKFGKQNYEELIGFSDLDLLDAEFANKTFADEQQIMESKLGRFNFIEHEVNSEGNDMWKKVSKIPLINDENNCVGTFGIINDITEFKLAELEKDRYNNNYNNLFHLVNENMCSLLLNENGIIIKANPKFCSLFDVNSKDIENIPFNKCLEPFLHPKAIAELNISEVIVNSVFEIEREYLIQDKSITLKEQYTTLENAMGKTEIILIALAS